jgi:hypothetical protein
MPLANKDARREYQRRYMREVWYPRNQEAQKARERARKKKNGAWWRGFKATLSCSHCDESEAATLDFHHVNGGTKEVGLSSVARSRGKQGVFAEMVKCVVVCANCHRKIHAGVLI